MITVNSRYDSNFYRTEHNEKGVYSYVVQPSIQLKVATAKSAVGFAYGLSAYFYDDESGAPIGLRPASEEDYVGHWASMDVSYKATRRLTVGLKESFYYTRRSDRYDDFYEDADLRKHYTNRLAPMLYYDFENRFAAGLRYQWQVLDYEGTDVGDAEENRVAVDLMYNPSRTTTLTLDYQAWTQDYKRGDQDYRSDQIMLSARKQYKYFFFEAGGGYQNRRFKETGVEDSGLSVYRFAAGWQNPPSSNAGRRIYSEDSSKLESHIYMDYQRGFNNLDSSRTDDRFTLSMGHLFLRKIKAWLKFYYTISEYDADLYPTVAGETTQPEDETTGVAGAVQYLLAEHCNLYLESGLTDRRSNRAGYNYDNLYFIFGVNFSQPLGRGSHGSQ